MDELVFYDALRQLTPGPQRRPGRRPDVVARELGIAPARARRMLEEWRAKGWWRSATKLRNGWFTERAPDELAGHN